MEKGVRIGTNPPTRRQGSVREGVIVLDDDAEFTQRTIDVAIDQKEIRRFPRDIGAVGSAFNA